MARNRKFVNVSEVPELLRLVKEVQDSGQECVLTHDNEEIAVLTPVLPARRRRPRKTGLIGEDDPLWDIVGMGASKGSGDISENKQRFLAEAYANTHK
jgi:antitoxin (DNA-binding transcriptional repressor) of toxin-antitoxin stability system